MGFPLCSLRCDDWSRGTGQAGRLHSTPLRQLEVFSAKSVIYIYYRGLWVVMVQLLLYT